MSHMIKATVDHVIPCCEGGKTEFTNCVTACRECNIKKGANSAEEAEMKLLREPFIPMNKKGKPMLFWSKNVFRRDEYVCQYCGKDVSGIE